jgi:WD40 repeat protein
LIDDAVLSPDGTAFLALERSYPGQPDAVRDSATLWHLPSGRMIAALTGPESVWPDVRFAPDSSWFATLDRHGVIRLRDTADGHVRGESIPALGCESGPRPMARWRAVSFSPDGRVVACATEPPGPPVVQLYDTTTGRPMVALEGAAEPIAFSPDGRTLASGLPGDADATIGLWDVSTGHDLNRLGDATTDRPGAIAFSPGGRRLAAGLPRSDGMERWSRGVTVWDLATRRAVLTLPARVVSSSYSPTYHRQGSGFEFSPDGRFLIVRGMGYGVFWDLAANPQDCLDGLLEINGDHTELGHMAFDHPLFTSDGARFVVAGRFGGTLAIYDAVILVPRAVVKKGLDGLQRPRSALSPDGRWLAVACRGLSSYPSRVEAWLARIVGRQFLWSGTHTHVKIVNMMTGAEVDHIPTDAAVLGFAADSRSFWTYTQTPTTINYPRANPTTLEVRRWAVPTGWPPAWLVALTVVGILLIAADWWHGRRRATAGRIP